MIKLPLNYQKSLSEIKFIDLFAGIGDFRLPLESFGANCVFSCEINKIINSAEQQNENNFKTYRKVVSFYAPQEGEFMV